MSQKWICEKVCAADSACAGLGLKKPTCGTNLCAGGSKTCFDNPF